MIATGGLTVDPNAPLLPTVALMAVLFGLSFFFSGTETALFSLQAVDRQQLANGGRVGKMVARLMGHRAATLTTILMGNEVANTALAATSAALTIRFFPDYPWMNVVLLTPALVLVSEITPKYMAFRTNRLWALIATPPLTVFATLVSPLRWVLERIVIAFARVFKADPYAITEGLEEAELLVLVDRGAATGALDASEREIIENVIELDATPIERVMTPKPDMFAVHVDITWEDLLQQCKTHRLSRIPVYDRRPDDVIGILLLKDLLRVRNTPKRRSRPRWLQSLLLPPRFMPASKPADDMFRDFVQRKYHMAFVVDEHGTLVGLVTLEDLVNELLGDSEPDTADSEITRPDEHGFLCRATVDLEDFIEQTGIEIPEGDFHTLGGFVFHQLGHLPRQGESINVDGVLYTVASMDDRRIVEIRVQVEKAQGAVG